MKKLTSLAIAVSLLGMTGVPVLAQVETVSEDQAINAVPKIQLKVNQGVNLKLPSGTRVYKGWLDDGTLAQLDGDRPFEQGASTLHIVARKSGQTQLSVIARDSEGVDSLYVFQLVAGSQGASIVNITANSIRSSYSNSSPRGTFVSDRKSVETQSADNRSEDGAEIFQRGMDLAISRGVLIQNSKLHRKLQDFTERVGRGMPVEQAAGRSDLNHRTIEQLFRLGQSAPRSFPTPKNEQLFVKVAPASTTQKPSSSLTETQSRASEQAELSPAVKERLAKLEERVRQLDRKVSQLDTQQEEFLARLDDLDLQQEIFTAQLDRISTPANSPKSRPIQITLESFVDEAPAPLAMTATVPETPLPVPVEPVGGSSLNSHDVANAITLGLLTHPDTRYRNWLYMRYQSMIRKLRSGADPISAARLSRINLEHVKSVLAKAGVDPQEAGL